MPEPLDRRSLLRGAAVVGVGGVAGFVVARTSVAADATATGAANAPGADTSGSGATLAELADVPDGGGLVLPGPRVVLTRSGSTVHAFSATCTHQGCTVSDVTDGRILCPCHGSAFDAATGAVLTGPATRPLPPVAVAVRAGAVVRTAGS